MDNEAACGRSDSTAVLGVPPRYVMVRDMNYPGEIMGGEWDGKFYVLADGDCYSHERLADEYDAVFSESASEPSGG